MGSSSSINRTRVCGREVLVFIRRGTGAMIPPPLRAAESVNGRFACRGITYERSGSKWCSNRVLLDGATCESSKPIVPATKKPPLPSSSSRRRGLCRLELRVVDLYLDRARRVVEVRDDRLVAALLDAQLMPSSRHGR